MLRRQKRTGQSFSDAIKERFRHGGTGATLRAAVETIVPDTSTLDATDALIASRDHSPARATEL